MRFQKAGLCPAAADLKVRTGTFPFGVRSPARNRSRRRAIAIATLVCGIVAAATHAPIASSPAAALASATSIAFAYWASMMLEALPFVLAGILAARILRRLPAHGIAAPLAAMFAPGCDCSINGFAPALARAKSPVAGFSLTWAAACGPVTLIATGVALGGQFVFARIAGGAVAAVATALLWSARSAGAADRQACGERDGDSIAARFTSAIAGVAAASLAAATLLTIAPSALRSSGIVAAAFVGAALSPCSTVDSILARAMLSSHASQAAFIIAAQCIDVRQMIVLTRTFGVVRAGMAFVAGCAGCAVAAVLAR